MGYFLLGFMVLAGFLLIFRWYTTVETRTLLKVLRWVGIFVLFVVFLVLLASGRLGLALGAAAFLLPWAMRTFRSASPGGAARSSATGSTERNSTIRTRFLHMTLDHRSGRLDGDVIDGPYAGRRLGEMSREALVALLADCQRQDLQAAQLLEAYLDRTDPQWRESVGAKQDEGSAGAASPDQGVMTRDDAYRVLGLEPGASDDMVNAVYHRLIASLHPDRGGSSYLAAQVNRARDVLLGR
ncbi:MAG: hypothetical protein JNM75_12300 [Rhodospirillales bacterium]|nr:hypothetical protein [Rhodospirillales bacterium]